MKQVGVSEGWLVVEVKFAFGALVNSRNDAWFQWVEAMIRVGDLESTASPNRGSMSRKPKAESIVKGGARNTTHRPLTSCDSD